MIRGYHQMKMRKDLELRFLDYKEDWKHKELIEIGSFIPQIELDEIETRLLCEMCEHAIKLNIFQLEKLEEIESLKTLERRETILENEEELDTIIFVLSESRKELIPKGRLKGQISFGF